MGSLLPTTARALDVHLAAAQREGRLPSVVAGVVRDGELVWSGARGRAVRLDSEERGGIDTQYKIGSVIKTMTAALVLLARERGELSLGDPVRRFLPDGPFPDATIRELLSHAAGLTAEPHGAWWERTDGGDRAALVAAHRGATPVLEPGSQLHYSNLGFGILGEIVAEIAGCSWFEALRAQVLDPLGLARTTYQAVEPAASGFSVDALTDEVMAEPLPDTGAMAPAGQLWSTVADLAIWLTALADPERSVLAAASLEDMRTPRSATAEDRTGQTWGLGVHVVRDAGRVLVGHGGSMPGFCCLAEIDVDARVGVVVLCNGAYGLGDVGRRMLRGVVAAEPALASEWRPAAAVPDDVRGLLGVWHWGHAPMRLRWTGGELLVDPVAGPGRVMAFTRIAADEWRGVRGYLRGETLRPIRDTAGAVVRLECATFVYTRAPYDHLEPS